VRALRYSFEEAMTSLWRGRRSSLLSVATIAAALVVLGVLLLVSWNVERLLVQWAAAAEMSIFLLDDVTPEARAAIEQTLVESDLVGGHEFVSKAQALIRFRRDFVDLSGVVEQVASNPFPASFEARLEPNLDDAAAVDRFATVLRGASGVEEVRFDQTWIERLTTAVNLLRGVGLVVALVLVVAVALTVANVIRLACFARRDEIEIMQLVGAPLAYVRGPFVLEGVIQGGIGAVAALVVLGIGFSIGESWYGETFALVLGVGTVRFLPPAMGFLLVVGGMAVGCVGGLVAARSTRARPETA
jgi:cell division transport system permease protein